VSHAAPVHHFKNRAGLFTAVATEGFSVFADDLAAAWEATGDFLDVGVAYVHFALTHRGHFEVMFRPDLTDEADAALVMARDRAYDLLRGPVSAGRKGTDHTSVRLAAVASWSTVHGLATLLLSGNLPGLADGPPGDESMGEGGVNLSRADSLTRRVLAHLDVI
jgi:AcrR family transcriptional regulator